MAEVFGDMAEEDYEWQPPTEAEMKIIQARRERSEKISKLMGDYLLKGYKMMGTTCEECGTILLKDRQQQDYCVSCNDLGSDTDKDNPAVNTEAARSHEREYQLFSGRQPMEFTMASANNPTNNIDCNTENQPQFNLTNQTRQLTSVANQIQVVNCNETVTVVQKKLNWATDELSKTTCVETSIQLCQLIKTCADTLASLKNLQLTK